MVLLVALLTMGVVLAVGASLLNVTLKQYQLSGISRASERAFHAADAGMECALYHDRNEVGGVPRNTFALGNQNVAITCMRVADGSSLGGVASDSGDDQAFEFDWGESGQEVCTRISVYKFYEDPADDGNGTGPALIVDGIDRRPAQPCPEGLVCTVIAARGYNVSCDDLSSRGTVERELTTVY